MCREPRRRFRDKEQQKFACPLPMANEKGVTRFVTPDTLSPQHAGMPPRYYHHHYHYHLDSEKPCRARVFSMAFLVVVAVVVVSSHLATSGIPCCGALFCCLSVTTTTTTTTTTTIKKPMVKPKTDVAVAVVVGETRLRPIR